MSKDLRRPREEKEEEPREMCHLPWWAALPGGRRPEGWERPERNAADREAGR